MSDIDVYFDYLCPFAYRAIAWLDDVRKLRPELQVNWRCFPIEQVNAEMGPHWKLWEQGDDHASQGMLAFRAFVAARHQGGEAFWRFHRAAGEARHVRKRTLTRRSTLEAIAEEAGLDLARFRRDIDDPAAAAEVGREYEAGRELFGVFGTPTIVTPAGGALYVQLDRVPPADETLPIFDDILRMADREPYLLEIKRPWMGGH